MNETFHAYYFRVCVHVRLAGMFPFGFSVHVCIVDIYVRTFWCAYIVSVFSGTPIDGAEPSMQTLSSLLIWANSSQLKLAGAWFPNSWKCLCHTMSLPKWSADS